MSERIARISLGQYDPPWVATPKRSLIRTEECASVATGHRVARRCNMLFQRQLQRFFCGSPAVEPVQHHLKYPHLADERRLRQSRLSRYASAELASRVGVGHPGRSFGTEVRWIPASAKTLSRDWSLRPGFLESISPARWEPKCRRPRSARFESEFPARECRERVSPATLPAAKLAIAVHLPS